MLKLISVFIFKSIFILDLIHIDWNSEAKSQGADRNSEYYLQRYKRQTRKDNYTIQLLMVVDYSVYEWWYQFSQSENAENKEQETTDNLIQYYAFVFNGIDKRYEGIVDPSKSYNLAFAGLLISKNRSLSWHDDQRQTTAGQDSIRKPANASYVLQTFYLFINQTYGQLPEHDHAMLFTGYNLVYGGTSSNTGLSFSESMCSWNAVSVVEDTYDTRTIGFASRELGRSLGSRSDTDGNTCRTTDYYIMTLRYRFTNARKAPNFWKFSTCSVDYFRDFIDQLSRDNKNCLNFTNEERYPPEIESLLQRLPGQLYDADKQCRLVHGPESYVCREEIKDDYPSICRGMYCYSNASSQCEKILPADGTACGSKKICSEATCVSFPDGDEVPDECPFGDQPIIKDPRFDTCEELVYNYPFACYNIITRSSCCKTCDEISTDIPGCKYGDRTNDCVKSNTLYSNETRTFNCCLTCGNDISSFSASPQISQESTLFSTVTTPATFTDILSTDVPDTTVTDVLTTDFESTTSPSFTMTNTPPVDPGYTEATMDKDDSSTASNIEDESAISTSDAFVTNGVENTNSFDLTSTGSPPTATTKTVSTASVKTTPAPITEEKTTTSVTEDVMKFSTSSVFKHESTSENDNAITQFLSTESSTYTSTKNSETLTTKLAVTSETSTKLSVTDFILQQSSSSSTQQIGDDNSISVTDKSTMTSLDSVTSSTTRKNHPFHTSTDFISVTTTPDIWTSGHTHITMPSTTYIMTTGSASPMTSTHYTTSSTTASLTTSTEKPCSSSNSHGSHDVSSHGDSSDESSQSDSESTETVRNKGWITVYSYQNSQKTWKKRLERQKKILQKRLQALRKRQKQREQIHRQRLKRLRELQRKLLLQSRSRRYRFYSNGRFYRSYRYRRYYGYTRNSRYYGYNGNSRYYGYYVNRRYYG